MSASKGTPVTYRTSNRCWVVLVSCFICTMIGFAIPVVAFGVFMAPIMEDLHSTAGEITMFMTMLTFGAIPAMVFGSKALERFGAGKVQAVASLLVGGGMILVAVLQNVPMVLLAGFMSGLGYPLLAVFGAPIIVSNWFYKRRSTMIGVALAAQGVGGMVSAPIFSALIELLGWQQALMAAGGSLALPLLLSIFVMRLSPLPYGILPYGATVEDVEQGRVDAADDGSPAGVLPGLTLRQASRTLPFALIVIVMLLSGFQACYNNQTNLVMQTAGYGPTVAGLIMSVMGFAGAVGNPACGYMVDKLGVAKTSNILFAMLGVGLIGFAATIYVHSIPLLVVSAFVASVGSVTGIALPSLYAQHTFGMKDYSTIYGAILAVRNFSTAITATLCGTSYDVLGSYGPVVIMWAATAFVAIPLALIAVRRGPKLWE